jgi:hypothetical protein
MATMSPGSRLIPLGDISARMGMYFNDFVAEKPPSSAVVPL